MPVDSGAASNEEDSRSWTSASGATLAQRFWHDRGLHGFDRKALERHRTFIGSIRNPKAVYVRMVLDCSAELFNNRQGLLNFAYSRLRNQ